MNPMVWQITYGISNDGELLGSGNKLNNIIISLEFFTVVTKSTTKACAACISSDIDSLKYCKMVFLLHDFVNSNLYTGNHGIIIIKQEKV